jgi:hypothetical protein
MSDRELMGAFNRKRAKARETLTVSFDKNNKKRIYKSLFKFYCDYILLLF